MIAVYSPSRRRSGLATSHKIFDTTTYCVPEEEVGQYVSAGLKAIGMPAHTNGNMAKVRNWILDNTPEQYILMVDDDITAMQWVEDHDEKRVRRMLTNKETNHILVNCFGLLEDLGMKLFGFNVQYDPRFYRVNRPFTFYLPILGPFSAIIKTELRYDESLPLKEDYDFFLQNVQKFGGVLRFNPVSYICDHQKMAGGCQLYRTSEKEKVNRDRLIAKWGTAVIDFEDGDINPIIRL